VNEILKATAVTKAYHTDGAEMLALRGVDFAVDRGEFVAIMGPSGCGKSTLLHLLGGLDRPTSGEIELDGRRVERLSEGAWAVIRRRQVGYMFQSFNLIANLSAADNIELPALMAGLSSAEARKRRKALSEELGIAGQIGQVPARMSGGQQQRVALARALINQPEVLLADEPTGNLDSQSTREVIAMLRRRNEQGQTIVLVTHDANVASAAGRVVRMRDGQVIGESRLEERTPASDFLRTLVDLEVG
jgi:putative ABC transport system ATP-binding protein